MFWKQQYFSKFIIVICFSKGAYIVIIFLKNNTVLWLLLLKKLNAIQLFIVQVKTKCIQFLKAVFKLEDKYIATGYIQALAPRLMELLCEEVPKTLMETHLIMLCEAISTIECLVQLAQSKHSKFIINIQLSSKRIYQILLIVCIM